MVDRSSELSHIRFEHREFSLFIVAIFFVQLIFFTILASLFNTPMSASVFGGGAIFCIGIFVYYYKTKKILNSIKLIMLSSYGVLLGNSFSYGGIFSPSLWWFSAFAVYVGIFFNKRQSKWFIGFLIFTIFAVYLGHIFDLIPDPEYVGVGREELFLISNVLLLLLVLFFNKLNQDNFSSLLLRTKNSEKQAYISANMASLGEMASSVAHEINNPLAIIKGNLQQLAKELERSHMNSINIEKKLEGMSSAVDRAAAIVSSLRSISINDQNCEGETSTILEVLEHITNLMGQKLRKVDVHLDVDLSIDILNTQIALSSVLLSQVFLSLINNAIDSVGSLTEKWIKIKASSEMGALQVYVIDSGKGIDQNVQDKMFNPLFSTKDVGKGNGLGLCISRSMLEKSGAALYYKELDGHTCFCLRLPVVS